MMTPRLTFLFIFLFLFSHFHPSSALETEDKFQNEQLRKKSTDKVSMTTIILLQKETTSATLTDNADESWNLEPPLKLTNSTRTAHTQLIRTKRQSAGHTFYMGLRLQRSLIIPEARTLRAAFYGAESSFANRGRRKRQNWYYWWNGGQNFGGQNFGGQNFGGQNFGGQNFGGQNFGGQNFAGQNFGGQNFRAQNFGGQNFAGQNFGGQNFRAQNFGGQNFGGYSYNNYPVANQNAVANFQNQLRNQCVQALPPPIRGTCFITQTQARFNMIDRENNGAQWFQQNPALGCSTVVSENLVFNQNGVTCNELCTPGTIRALLGICTPMYCNCELAKSRWPQQCQPNQVYDPVKLACTDPRESALCSDDSDTQNGQAVTKAVSKETFCSQFGFQSSSKEFSSHTRTANGFSHQTRYQYEFQHG